MHYHMSALPIVMYQQFFYFRGFVVCLFKRYLAIHEDMQFDGVVVTYAACT